SVSFCLVLRGRHFTQLAALVHVAVLIAMLYGTAPIVEHHARLTASWRHLGITDYVIHTGTVDPNIDAYFNWPGFFILQAFWLDASGIGASAQVARWAPLLLDIAYLFPLVMICRAASRDSRIVWLAIWFFYLSNWAGQDYFSPQGFTYFLFLLVVALALRYGPRGVVAGSGGLVGRIRHRREHEGADASMLNAVTPDGEQMRRRIAGLA